MKQTYADIARRVRELREIAGISRETIAKDLKVEVDRYQRFEEGVEDIPVGVLLAVASRLGADVTSLISGEEPKLKEFCLIRKGRGLEVERRKEYRYRNLTYNFAGRLADAFLVTVEPGKGSIADARKYSHAGQELNYLLSGRLMVVVGGHELVLEEGDSLYFDSGLEHAMVAVGGSSATFLAVTIKA